MAKLGRSLCPECGAPMVPTLRGKRCPRLSACGRGGIEETGDDGSPVRGGKGARA